MTAPVIVRDLIVAHTRALKLPGIARVFEALARQARDAHWPHEDYLHEALSAELASRHESVIRQRLREARFPEVKVGNGQFRVSCGPCSKEPCSSRTNIRGDSYRLKEKMKAGLLKSKTVVAAETE